MVELNEELTEDLEPATAAFLDLVRLELGKLEELASKLISRGSKPLTEDDLLFLEELSAREDRLSRRTYWCDGKYDDKGDLPLETRNVLIRLVKGERLFSFDQRWDDLYDGLDSIQRELSNLGLQLFIDKNWMCAWAAEVDRTLTNLPLLRRRVKLSSPAMDMILRLRRHYNMFAEDLTMPVPITIDEIRDLWFDSPHSEKYENDEKRGETAFAGLLDTLTKTSLGVLSKVPKRSLYQVLPSIQIIAGDDLYNEIIKVNTSDPVSSQTSEDTDNAEFTTGQEVFQEV